MRIRILLLVVLAYLTPTIASVRAVKSLLTAAHIPGSATLKVRESSIVVRCLSCHLSTCVQVIQCVRILIIPNETFDCRERMVRLQNAALIWDERKNAKLKVLDKDDSWLETRIVELKCSKIVVLSRTYW